MLENVKCIMLHNFRMAGKLFAVNAYHDKVSCWMFLFRIAYNLALSLRRKLYSTSRHLENKCHNVTYAWYHAKSSFFRVLKNNLW